MPSVESHSNGDQSVIKCQQKSVLTPPGGDRKGKDGRWTYRLESTVAVWTDKVPEAEGRDSIHWEGAWVYGVSFRGSYYLKKGSPSSKGEGNYVAYDMGLTELQTPRGEIGTSAVI